MDSNTYDGELHDRDAGGRQDDNTGTRCLPLNYVAGHARHLVQRLLRKWTALNTHNSLTMNQ